MKKVLKCVGYILLASTLLVFVVYAWHVMVIESKTPLESAPLVSLFMKVDGEELAYRFVDNHSSTTILFVGGLSAWSGTWERVTSVMNAKHPEYNYLAMDLPPFGYSSIDMQRPYFRDVQARRISGLVQALKLERLIVVAHSYGAGPSTEFVMQGSSQVVRLVIIDGVLNIDEVKPPHTFGIVDVAPLRSVLLGVLVHNESFATSRLKSFVHITDNIDAPLMHTYMRYFDTKGTTQRLSSWLRDYVADPLGDMSTKSEQYKKLTIPVRLIWGVEDTITPLSETHILLESIPDVSLHALPGIGHIPMIENYAVFDDALLNAIEK